MIRAIRKGEPEEISGEATEARRGQDYPRFCSLRLFDPTGNRATSLQRDPKWSKYKIRNIGQKSF